MKTNVNTDSNDIVFHQLIQKHSPLGHASRLDKMLERFQCIV